MSGNARRFCSDVARERGEPLAGTGALPERILLVRWPRRLWRRKRTAEGMSDGLAAAMRAAAAVTPLALFVDAVGGTPAALSLRGFPENRVFETNDEAALAGAMLRWAAGEPLAGREERRTTILCCTDGRTDACCARFGFATAKALAASADPARFNVLQCNHLGGCRFAASLLVLPRRERYGRLEPAETGAFLAAVGGDSPYLPLFRGSPALSEPAQVADLAARRWAAEAGIEAPIELGAVEADAAGAITVEAAVGTHRLAIGLVPRAMLRHGSCSSLAEGTPVEVTRWVLGGVAER